MYNNINQINAIYGKLFCVIWVVSFIKFVHTDVRTELQRVNRNINLYTIYSWGTCIV